MSAKKNNKPVASGKKASTKRTVRPAPRASATAEPGGTRADAGAIDSAEPQPAASQPLPEEPAAAAKPSRRKPQQPRPEGQLSALDAAAKVLAEAGTSLSSGQMIEAMAEKGYWKSPGGKTPAATLFSAILREINTKGDASRFVKTERGKFALKA